MTKFGDDLATLALVTGAADAIQFMESRDHAMLMGEAIKLPIQGSADSMIVALGIQFGEPVDHLWRTATLPSGWTLGRDGDDPLRSYVLDERGLRRACVFFKRVDQRAELYPRSPATEAVYEFADGKPIPWDLLTPEEHAVTVASLRRVHAATLNRVAESKHCHESELETNNRIKAELDRLGIGL